MAQTVVGQLNPPYALTLLSEYTHTLDSLPIDLSRNFADLRELDAVLSSSIQSITSKIYSLITMIEEDKAPKEDRLWLLSDIADEAQRLKLGGEDKIRVACQGADNLKGHASHLRALTDNIPGFDSSLLDRKTTYPHVSEHAYRPTFVMETGRRRRGGLGSIMVASNPDPSPAKRKRVGGKEDDIDITGRSPKKPAHNEGSSRARKKKTERGASPSESLLSVATPLPHPLTHSTSGSGRSGGGGSSTSRGGGGQGANVSGSTSAANKRRTGANATTRGTPLANEVYSASHDPHGQGHTNGSSSRRGGASSVNGGDAYGNGLPPSSSHPSLPVPSYQNGTNGHHHANGYDVQANGLSHIAGSQDWNSIPRAQQLEGPGMPVARSASIHSTAASVAVVNGVANVDSTDAGDADGDGDDRTYCFCDKVSYGEMIACDDENCEREWFHLGCIGLASPPQGSWFCDACKTKKTGKKQARGGGKRRTGGGRASGR
ncbi:hypothetical protein CPB83DRAFT_30269 [Crepidotus variabilis]|uniref:Chromatin modification-related protein n=1 Tax=Crepidotus variabilis TaxID=179855 RepID=A0A9P6ET68_9AGAR|nr:hypothetical protein CPB83DRAFT_30269 [Crepidotus variabilis]